MNRDDYWQSKCERLESIALELVDHVETHYPRAWLDEGLTVKLDALRAILGLPPLKDDSEAA